jgi:hypothetical protein
VGWEGEGWKGEGEEKRGRRSRTGLRSLLSPQSLSLSLSHARSHSRSRAPAAAGSSKTPAGAATPRGTNARGQGPPGGRDKKLSDVAPQAAKLELVALGGSGRGIYGQGGKELDVVCLYEGKRGVRER